MFVCVRACVCALESDARVTRQGRADNYILSVA